MNSAFFLRTIILLVWLPAIAFPNDTVFREITQEAGLNFDHFNGMTGEFLLPEIMGPGAAFLDYDGDGDQDIFLVQGATYPSGKTKPPLYPFKGKPTDILLRNDLKDGKVKLVDVTKQAGLSASGFGMGVTVGDIDNDGFPDIYVTNLGNNILWRNKGDGTFEDITQASGTNDPHLSTSAIFADVNGDGFLDLFVSNYMRFTSEDSPKCYAANSALDYCGPDAYPAQGDRLFVNKGDGTFRDQTYLLASATPGAGLGVEILDADNDGLLDIYVANDGDPNHLWRNKGDGTFEEAALFSGIALNGEGVPEAGMGVTAGDVDGDGDEDIFLTHLESETNTLYVNDGGFFDDGSAASGLGLPSMPFTGFGTRFFDLQNDGHLDLLVLNGAVRTMLEQAAKDDPYPLKQANQIFVNNGKGKFTDISERGGKTFRALEVSRGAAFGDVDNDGAIDMLLINNLGPARLYTNNASKGSHWLGVSVKAKGDKRHALGAVVKLTLKAGDKPLMRRVNRGGSYLSAHDPRVLFGLGTHTNYHQLEVVWPDGHKQVFAGGKADRYMEVRRKN